MIDFSTITSISMRAVRANKMRSTLTSLGIIIGVAAVIVMLSIGNGAQMKIQEQIKSAGSNLIMILSGASTSSGARMGGGSQPTLKLSDANAIENELASVATAAPMVSEVGQVIYGNKNWSTSIVGSDNRALVVRDWKLEAGRRFSENDLKNAAKVTLIGQTVAKELFGDVDPLNKIIRVKGIPFEVVGILAVRGQSGNGQDQDDTIYIPLSTAQKKVLGTQFPDMVKRILVQAIDIDHTYIAEGEIAQLLRQRHGLGQNKEDDFTIRNFAQFMEMMKESTKVMTILLGSIASISLLVGGIGIMNIMLVSVTERTREIGIRMAIGAKAMDIRLQFLMEALVLSLIGGLIGIIIGLAGVVMMNYLSSFPVKVSLLYIILPFSFSGIVGLFFGYFPAYKASKLNPINALRYE
jgi:putative ABC transport system permease protein